MACWTVVEAISCVCTPYEGICLNPSNIIPREGTPRLRKFPISNHLASSDIWVVNVKSLQLRIRDSESFFQIVIRCPLERNLCRNMVPATGSTVWTKLGTPYDSLYRFVRLSLKQPLDPSTSTLQEPFSGTVDNTTCTRRDRRKSDGHPNIHGAVRHVDIRYHITDAFLNTTKSVIATGSAPCHLALQHGLFGVPNAFAKLSGVHTGNIYVVKSRGVYSIYRVPPAIHEHQLGSAGIFLWNIRLLYVFLNGQLIGQSLHHRHLMRDARITHAKCITSPCRRHLANTHLFARHAGFG